MSYLVIVYIVSGKNKKEVVGVFKKVKEAEEFKNRYYGDSWRREINFAKNKETLRYFKCGLYKQRLVPSPEFFVESNEMTQTEDNE